MTQLSPHNDPTTVFVHDLASELLHEVFKYVDWRGLASANLTCRRWNSAMQSWHLWFTIAKTFVSEPFMIPPEEPLMDYTVNELRVLVMKRLRAQEGWSTENPFVRTNILCLEYPLFSRQRKLLPGGRWLLILDLKGRVFSCDLDKSEFEERLLIDPGQEFRLANGDSRMDMFTFWVDFFKEKLSFRISLWNSFNGREHIINYIYQVDLVGHGKEAYLEAYPLEILRDNQSNVERIDVALTDTYLAEIWSVTHFDETWSWGIYLFRYPQSNGDDYQEKRIRVEFNERRPDFCEIHMTSEGQIIMMKDNHISIYTIDQIEAHDTRLRISPLHRHPFQLLYNRTSPFTNNGFTWIVAGHNDELHLTRISTSSSTPQIITTTLGSHPRIRQNGTSGMICTDRTCSVILQADQSIDILKYGWNSSMECSTLCVRRSISLPNQLLAERHSSLTIAGVDETTGRVVFSYPAGCTTIVIMDIVANNSSSK